MADYSRLPGAVADRWQWQGLGACRSLPTTVFFHPDFERGPQRRHRDTAAKAVCHRCPVMAECRRYALQVEEPYGVWGGLSAEQRADLLRARRRAAAPPATMASHRQAPHTA